MRRPLLASAVVLMLAGCAADSDISLAEAKSNVQLLRNDAASRIPADLVDIVLVSSDLSVSCEPESTDPEGLLRSWHSGARISLQPGADLSAVIDDLAGSFVAQGWEQSAGSSATATTLSNPTIFSDIEITASPEDEDAGRPAEITLALSSPCVVTDGESSKEVRQLEAMAF
jgi:hypothetical protein